MTGRRVLGIGWTISRHREGGAPRGRCSTWDESPESSARGVRRRRVARPRAPRGCAGAYHGGRQHGDRRLGSCFACHRTVPSRVGRTARS